MRISIRGGRRRRLSYLAVVGIAGLLGLAVGGSQAQRSGGPLPFPQHFNYPLSAGDLERKVQARDAAYLRRHGWYLWAGINQPGRDGWPLWASWPIATQVFAPPLTATRAPDSTEVGAAKSLAVFNAAHKAQTSIANPFYEVPAPVAAKYHLPPGTLSANYKDGDTFQNNGDIMLVSEAYDGAAFAWLRGRGLYEQSTLQGLLDEKKTDIPQMPNLSIVLKHMYWPVAGDKLTALPTIDMAHYATREPAYIGFEDKAHWPQGVAIDATGRRIGQSTSVTYLYDVLQSAPKLGSTLQPPRLGPVTYSDAKVVGLSDFYSKRLSRAEVEAMSVRDRILIDSSFYWATGRLFQDGDYLVAIASHIMTKEMPRWTLQTVWWHPDPSGDYAADKPDIPEAKGPWRHYLLAVEDGIPDKSDPGMLPIAYNPYIELAADHAVATNCRNCHIRAAWPNGTYLAPKGPGSLAVIDFDDPIFKGNLRTDFLWTVTDRAYAPKSK